MNSMSTGVAAENRSAELLATLAGFADVTVIMHDNPDPDAIASGWAVAVLVEDQLGLPVRVVGGGAIVRAENRHMVDLLQPPIHLVDTFELSRRTATVLVDCSPTNNNQLLKRLNRQPVGVIDHHVEGGDLGEIAFVDVRSDVAASASITANYLRERAIEPGLKLATALLYAIRTETMGYETVYSPLDRSVLPWLTERGDPGLLAEIENAPLAREYYGDLVLALQNAFLYNDVAVCVLPQAQGVEIVGEVADILIRCERVNRVLCGAVVGPDLYLSARTATESGHAAWLLQQTLERLGSAGGHRHRAGGKVGGATRPHGITDEMVGVIRQRWLSACDVAARRGTRLVARRDIVDNL